MMKMNAVVIRDGLRKEIDAKELVPGDLVVLGAGIHIPGDGHILQGAKLSADKAIPEAEKAVALSPSSAWAVFMLGTALLHSERFEEAIPYFKKSLRLSPTANRQCLLNLGSAYRFLGRYDEAIETYQKALKLQPDYVPAHVALTAAYALAGRLEESRSQTAEVMRIDPQFSLELYAKTYAFRKELVDKVVEALRKAGLK